MGPDRAYERRNFSKPSRTHRLQILAELHKGRGA